MWFGTFDYVFVIHNLEFIIHNLGEMFENEDCKGRKPLPIPKTRARRTSVKIYRVLHARPCVSTSLDLCDIESDWCYYEKMIFAINIFCRFQ